MNSSNKNILVASVIKKGVEGVFLEHKKQEIGSYLRSIRLQDHILFIETGNALINSELLLLNDKIEGVCREKLSDLGVGMSDLKIVYK